MAIVNTLPLEQKVLRQCAMDNLKAIHKKLGFRIAKLIADVRAKDPDYDMQDYKTFMARTGFDKILKDAIDDAISISATDVP